MIIYWIDSAHPGDEGIPLPKNRLSQLKKQHAPKEKNQTSFSLLHSLVRWMKNPASGTKQPQAAAQVMGCLARRSSAEKGLEDVGDNEVTETISRFKF